MMSRGDQKMPLCTFATTVTGCRSVYATLSAVVVGIVPAGAWLSCCNATLPRPHGEDSHDGV